MDELIYWNGSRWSSIVGEEPRVDIRVMEIRGSGAMDPRLTIITSVRCKKIVDAMHSRYRMRRN